MTQPDPALALDARAGLPDALRILLETHPRAHWEAHSNFNDHTRFWLDRHLMFRRLQAHLADEAEGFLDGRSEDRAFARGVHRYAGMFINELHAHHSIEDHHYFPMLKAAEPRLERGFEILDTDHAALHAHLDTLTERTNAMLGGLIEGGDARAAAERYRDSVAAFRRFLDRHLTDEEELVVPVILEHGPVMG